MSFDEFDPAIERLFGQAPMFPDSDRFNADVAARLNSSSRVRTVTLSVAGLLGGVVAVKEMLGLRVEVGDRSLMARVGGPPDTAADARSALESFYNGLGMANIDYGAISQMHAFWGAAALVVALLAIGAVKLYQQV